MEGAGVSVRWGGPEPSTPTSLRFPKKGAVAHERLVPGRMLLDCLHVGLA